MADTDHSNHAAAPPRASCETDTLAMRMCVRMMYDSPDTIPEIAAPLSVAEAERFAQSQAGLGGGLGSPNIDLCWHRFSLTTTPEQKLSYQRLITALAVSRGMERHIEGARICAENAAREQAEREQLAEEKALDRWRDPKLAT
ncbi:hypothetical protein M3484_20920 [Pseudomonas sp. GX19020]|uniref:hypothetical protein n=1 Tax=Pseudomonas sp. GX19020 TaxID=2942277 RepID=UPI0020199812|nr:hypothetical protein [Pseudomonas sp. GX19020]MCL4069024.1 hypothetical protein [Pseudomonas sp. GX19020]